MIRNAFQSTVQVSKSFSCGQLIKQNSLNKQKSSKIENIQIIHKKYIPLLNNTRYYYLKNDVTIDYKKNYYEILKVNEKATLIEIKRNFYKLAKESHPDTSKGNEDLFKQINEAYNILSHQQRRKVYDVNRYRPAVQNPNDQKAQQQQNRTASNQQGTFSGSQDYKHSQQYTQRKEEAYYHYNQGQWQQFRQGYKYHLSPESQYYQNLTNNVSSQKIYQNLRRKVQNKTENEEKFLEQMQRYFEYEQKIKNKKSKDIEDYHKKMQTLEKQMYEERRRKFLNTLVGKSYLRVVNVMEKVSNKLQSFLTKENQKQK